MFGKALVRAGWKFAIFYSVAIVVLYALAVVFSDRYESTWVSFKDMLFLGGLAVIAFGGLVGAGFTHNAYYNNFMYRVSSAYQHAVNDDRLERRRSEFAFMIYCLVGGGALALLPFILP